VTLAELGKEESGTQHLAEAVQIFNEVLTVRTREAMPYEWAITQEALGECLSALAELEPGRGYEAQAVAAEKSALEVLTLQADPAAWARARAALGIALSSLGREDNAPEKLQEAISALRLGATKELRTLAPIAWSEEQAALAVALLTLGYSESNEEASSGSDWRRLDRLADEHLQEAVAAARAGLEEASEKATPQLWARLKGQLGATLETIGEREANRGEAVALDHFGEAAEAERSALRALTSKNAPDNWANAECELGDALEALGEHQANATCLEQAIAAYRDALTVQTLDKEPADWNDDEDRLAYALERLGMLEKGEAGIPHLQEAIEDLKAVAKTRSPDRDLDAWLLTERNLAKAEAELGRRELGTGQLEQAAQAYRDELKHLSPERSPQLWKQASEGLNNVLNQLRLRGENG
jgi:tetratricopeptide (TPR) repeat protein